LTFVCSNAILTFINTCILSHFYVTIHLAIEGLTLFATFVFLFCYVSRVSFVNPLYASFFKSGLVMFCPSCRDYSAWRILSLVSFNCISQSILLYYFSFCVVLLFCAVILALPVTLGRKLNLVREPRLESPAKET